MDRKIKILIIEDDKTTCMELENFLQREGYETSVMQDFSNAEEEALEAAPALVLLDVDLRGANGPHICEQIRRASQIPFIFVMRDDTSMDELDYIMRGGDDYIFRPFRLEVLPAHIEAVLRRTLGRTVEKSMKWEYKGVTLDTAAGEIIKAGQRQGLNGIELKILYCLYQHPGEIISCGYIIDYLWDHEVFIDYNTLSTIVACLRGKLKEIGAEDFIETKLGLGYRI